MTETKVTSAPTSDPQQLAIARKELIALSANLARIAETPTAPVPKKEQ